YSENFKNQVSENLF
ncbi:hypothetical protein, partial [Flavobacterium psychrophilum]